MAKRANGEGTIVQRSDGRWTAAFVTSDGKRKWLYGKRQRDVQEKLQALRAAERRGEPMRNERLSTGTFLGQWLLTMQAKTKARTYQRYEQYVRLHIKPAIGKVPLARLSREHLRAMYDRALDAGLSPRTARHVHVVTHNALAHAVKQGLVARNVADIADPPRARRTEMKTLTAEQASALLDASRGHRLEALFVVALTTGLRQGELLALRWADIDLSGENRRGRPTLLVRSTLQRTKSGFAFEEPKTKASVRTVLMPDAAVAALKRHRAAQSEERLRLGASWTDMNLVFANEVGKPIEAQNMMRRAYYPLL